MKLSIIICVYNTPREYLEECISSVVNSTLSLGEYEILMVDDGSSYDYSDIVTKYGIRYTRHKNSGILYSRLCGIRMADGDYITFVDSDDTVSVNYHYPMLALSDGADIVSGDWAFHTDKCKYVCSLDKLLSNNVYKTEDNVLRYFTSEGGRQHSLYVLWNKIFRKEILKRVESTLCSTSEEFPFYNYSEDALISFFAHKYAKSFKNIHTGYYFYRIHQGQSISVISKERLVSHIDFMSRTLDIMYSSSEGNVYSDEIRENIDKWRALMSRTHFSYAKTGRYTDLYPYIMEKYGVNTLEKTTLDDGRYYVKARVLPKNLSEIDGRIRDILFSDTTAYVDRESLDAYAEKTLEFISQHSDKIIFSKTPNIVIPKEKSDIMQTIIHNYTISKIGLILFPKGSRIRSFLKKHL